jgi:hypothetical protein
MPADLNFFDLLQAGAGEHKYVYKAWKIII